MLWTSGRIDESVREFQIATELNPDDYQSPNLMVSLLQDGENEDEVARIAEISVQRCRKQLDNHPEDARALYFGAGSLVALGRNDEAVEWAERAITIQPTTDTFYNVACVYVRLGDCERAIELLERADMRGRNQDWMINDPDLADLRGHPRFEALLKDRA
jgi:adenylate cyclase